MLFAVDTLLNAMPNAIYPLSLGAIATLGWMPAARLTEGSEPPPDTDGSPATPPRRRLWPPRGRNWRCGRKTAGGRALIAGH